MHAIWKGSVSFGLVSIPVKVFSATQEKDISFRQVHAADGGRIRYRRICEQDGEEVAYADIAKGYELADGQMLVLTGDDLAELPLPSKKVVEVLEFVRTDEIDPIYVNKSYYLQPDSAGAKPYALLRDALVRTGQVAVVKVALRNRESLGMLRPKENLLLLQTLLWPDEVRDGSFAEPGEDVEIRPQEEQMAESYIQTLQTSFDPDRYHDEYRSALEKVIEAKTEGIELEPAAPGPATEVVDLMSALAASVEEAKRQRAGGGADAAEDSDEGTEAAQDAEREPAGDRGGSAGGSGDSPSGDSGSGAGKGAGKTTGKGTRTRKTSATKASGKGADQTGAKRSSST